jgi:hypothetical protein
MNWIKKLFAQATPMELAVAELVDAQREKLQAESGAEYAEALVIYNQSRIERLTAYVAQLTKEQAHE